MYSIILHLSSMPFKDVVLDLNISINMHLLSFNETSIVWVVEATILDGYLQIWAIPAGWDTTRKKSKEYVLLQPNQPFNGLFFRVEGVGEWGLNMKV